MTRARPTGERAPKKSELTRARVLDAALALFRRRGATASSMRDVARAAGLSLGAAYYYFRSKDDLLLAWYDRVQEEHAARARAAFAATTDVRARVAAALETKLDVVGKDRRLLGALVAAALDPSSEAGLFSPHSRARAQAIEIFAEALAPARLSAAALPAAARGLWALHLGILLYFVHDKSAGQAKSRALAAGCAALLPDAVAALAPLGPRLVELLRGADLLG